MLTLFESLQRWDVYKLCIIQHQIVWVKYCFLTHLLLWNCLHLIQKCAVRLLKVALDHQLPTMYVNCGRMVHNVQKTLSPQCIRLPTSVWELLIFSVFNLFIVFIQFVGKLTSGFSWYKLLNFVASTFFLISIVMNLGQFLSVSLSMQKLHSSCFPLRLHLF